MAPLPPPTISFAQISSPLANILLLLLLNRVRLSKSWIGDLATGYRHHHHRKRGIPILSQDKCQRQGKTESKSVSLVVRVCDPSTTAKLAEICRAPSSLYYLLLYGSSPLMSTTVGAPSSSPSLSLCLGDICKQSPAAV